MTRIKRRHVSGAERKKRGQMDRAEREEVGSFKSYHCEQKCVSPLKTRSDFTFLPRTSQTPPTTSLTLLPSSHTSSSTAEADWSSSRAHGAFCASTSRRSSSLREANAIHQLPRGPRHRRFGFGRLQPRVHSGCRVLRPPAAHDDERAPSGARQDVLDVQPSATARLGVTPGNFASHAAFRGTPPL